MSVSETSLKAFQSLKKLGDKQQQVFDALGELGIASNEDIADYLGWPINRVTGRMSELRSYGYAVVHGVKKSKSGATAKTWCAADPLVQKQIDLHEEIVPKLDHWQPAAVSWLND